MTDFKNKRGLNMIRQLAGVALAGIMLLGGTLSVQAAPGDGGSKLSTAGNKESVGGPSQELRGVWISYLDWRSEERRVGKECL